LLPNTGQINDAQTYNIGSQNTAEIDSSYYADAPGQNGLDVYDAIRPWTTFIVGFARNLLHPQARTEWVSADPNTQWWHLTWETNPFGGEFDGTQPRIRLAPASRRPGSMKSRDRACRLASLAGRTPAPPPTARGTSSP
jgi:hypothetical protein